MKANIFNLGAALAGLTLLSLSQAKKLMCSVATVSGLLWLSAVGAPASAVGIFSFVGGTSGTLDANFLFVGWNPATNFGITTGTAIDIFNSGNASSGGLFVAPQNVRMTFTFEGASAGFTNFSDGSFNFSDLGTLFNNHTTPIGTSASALYNVGSNPGLVPFSFKSTCFNLSCSHIATNGGPIDTHTLLAFADNSTDSAIPVSTAYAFLEDSAAGGDHDFNDMVVRMDLLGCNTCIANPLPTTLPLLATGLGGLGLLGWRRKRKAQAAA